MKTKLTIYDCFKYPNAVIREYKNGKQIEGEYKNILQLISFKCLTVWNEPNKQIKDVNKHLSKCKLVLKDANEIIKSIRVPFYDKVIYMSELNPLIENLRADNYDIDEMKDTGRAVYET